MGVTERFPHVLPKVVRSAAPPCGTVDEATTISAAAATPVSVLGQRSAVRARVRKLEAKDEGLWIVCSAVDRQAFTPLEHRRPAQKTSHARGPPEMARGSKPPRLAAPFGLT
jgi:hypothetical protein